MEYFLPVVFLLIQCRHTYALVLPVPVNVSVDSTNFRHVVTWDPGLATPPGTKYRVTSKNGRNKSTKDSSVTRAFLKLKNELTYLISVRAVYNISLQSEESTVYSFCPFKDTKIDAPHLSLVGGDQHLQVNVSLPKAPPYAKIPDILKYYDAKMTISWKTAGSNKLTPMDMTDYSTVLGNLEVGMEYCVQVHLKIRQNPHTRPSKFVCASTSVEEPSQAPRIIGITVPILILVVVGTCGLLFILHYTGFLCGVKAHLPAALLMVLGRGYFITPETTITERVCLNPEAGKRRARNTQAVVERMGLQLDDEEDSDQGEQLYVNRAGDLSSDSDSQNAPGDSSGDSGASAFPTVDRVVPMVERPLTGSRVQPDVSCHSIKGPVLLDEERHGIGVDCAVGQGEWGEKGVSVDGRRRAGEEQREEGDVNLLSVTLVDEENSGNVNMCSVIFDGFKEPCDDEPDAECAPRGSLLPSEDREPHGTPSRALSQRCTPADTEGVCLPPILNPGQSHGGTTGYTARGGTEDHDTSSGHLSVQGGETDCEEEDSGGYLGRC